MASPKKPDLRLVPYTSIRETKNYSRTHYLDIPALADAIRANGLDDPIAVVENDGWYEVVNGGRRYRAWGLLHAEDPKRYANMPVILRTFDDEASRAKTNAGNNFAHREPSLYEKFETIRALHDLGLTQRQIADSTSLSIPSVSRFVGWQKLHPRILRAMQNGADIPRDLLDEWHSLPLDDQDKSWNEHQRREPRNSNGSSRKTLSRKSITQIIDLFSTGDDRHQFAAQVLEYVMGDRASLPE